MRHLKSLRIELPNLQVDAVLKVKKKLAMG